MSHNTRVRADYAAWAIGTGVSAAEFEKFDDNLFKAINGDDGGTWAPSAPIALGGEGMRFIGAMLSVDADGTFEIHCDALFSGASQFTGLTSFTSGLAVSGTGSATFGVPVVANGTVTCNGNVTVGNAGTDTLTVNSAETHNGQEVHGGLEYHNGQEVHNGDIELLGDVTIGASTSDALLIRSAATLQGTINFTGAVSFATDSIRDTYQEVTSAIDVTLTYTSQHINVVTMTAGGNAVRLTAPAGNSSRSKVIKNPASAAYSFQVIDSSTSTQLANLSPGQECTVITTTTRWI